MTDRPATHNDLNALRREVNDLKEAAVEHRVRLENGTNVFRDYSARIGAIEEKITPKPPSIAKIIGITLTIVFAGAGALWGLANMLRDRPTADQIRDVVQQHDDVGHKSIREDVHDIHREQSQQRVLIEQVTTAQGQQDKKLDRLLEQTKDSPPPRRRR